MKPILIEPIDTFFFRDSIPMSAGQGRGAGARLPLPSTLHEAFRSSLLYKYGRTNVSSAFRPKDAPRKGGWQGKATSVASNGTKDFQSLQINGPFPYLVVDKKQNKAPHGLFFPMPLDLVFDSEGKAHVLKLQTADKGQHSAELPALAASPVPPMKNSPKGFLSTEAMSHYLKGDFANIFVDAVLPWEALFEEEYRIGVELDPDSNSAVKGQLYAATHARPTERFRIAAWAGLKTPVNDEIDKLNQLDHLLLGGERRLMRIQHDVPTFSNPSLPLVPEATGPQIVKWTLATSAVFANGWLPGWCKDTQKRNYPDGRVCFKLSKGRADLVATCLGKPIAFAGWDVVAHRSKPTQLAVPAGSIYYFLCENTDTAQELAALLHWRARSDFYGEKGFGYGFASFYQTYPDIQKLADHLYKP